MPTALRNALLAPLLLGSIACSKIPNGRSVVDEVTVSNLHTISASDVEDRLATAASPKFFGLFRGVVYDYNVFDETTLQRDLARVERYLRGQGFLDATARAGRVTRLSSTHVRVDILVDEGLPTLNRNVTVRGTTAAGLPWSQTVTLSPLAEPALHAAWARGRIRDLEDRHAVRSDAETAAEILRVSLAEKVLSRFTAFIAVDHNLTGNTNA